MYVLVSLCIWTDYLHLLYTSCHQFLPQQFTLANGLINKKCGLIIRDERQRSWNLKLSCDSIWLRTYIIGDGWRKFVKENYLKEGYHIMFKILTNGETPVWKFRVILEGKFLILIIRICFIIIILKSFRVSRRFNNICAYIFYLHNYNFSTKKFVYMKF